MIREAFKVIPDPQGGRAGIFKVEITDPDGVSWQEAKRDLRKFYLDQAATLRSVTKASYFGESNV